MPESAHPLRRALATLAPLLLGLLLAVAQAQPATRTFVPGLSGGWWDPARSGEGFQIEVLSESSALAIWYTYPAVDDPDAAEQLWIGGPGRIEGDVLVIDPALVTRGPAFGPGFDPADLEQEHWGRLSFAFSDCNRGTVDYAGPPGYGSGRIALQRFTGNPRMPCSDAPEELPPDTEPDEPPPPSAAIPGLSGTWYDPSHSGEGWFLQEIAPGIAVVMWFSFDGEGRPAHFLGVGRLADRSLPVPDVQRARGTFFGADFDRNDVEREIWGDLHIVFDGCSSATLSWRSPLAEFGNGTLHPRRLTRSDALECRFPPVPALASGSWSQQGGAPRLSELPAAVLDGRIHVAGGFGGGGVQHWRFDPGTGQWLRLADLPASRHHGQMASFEGALYFFGGFVTERPVGFVPQFEAWRYDPASNAWAPLAPLPTPKGAGSAVVHGDAIFLVGGEPAVGMRYRPAADSWDILALDDPWPRDHSTAVIYQGEIWILGGRSEHGPSSNRVTIYNPLAGVTREGPSMRSGRSGFAATVLDGQILAAGGEDLTGPVLTTGAEYYDPEQRVWRDAPAIATPVHGMAAASVEGRAWFLLGSTQPGGVDNPGIVQAFTPPAD